MATIKMGILGDFRPDNPTHRATGESIRHAANAIGKPIEAVWLPTDEPHLFAQFQGFVGAPGSPYKSLAGALDGIRYAREHGVPFLGTCGGFQHLVIEYARNVMGIHEAAHAETDPYASRLVVTPLSCSLAGKTMDVTISPGTRAACVFPGLQTTESFYCNFGLNPAYEQALQTAGLTISGRDQNGEPRIAELSHHPFYFGTLFVPQARSTLGSPHPLVLELCRRAAGRQTSSSQNAGAERDSDSEL
jgi:CTP synthase (UTP-ammonia lyase)